MTSFWSAALWLHLRSLLVFFLYTSARINYAEGTLDFSPSARDKGSLLGLPSPNSREREGRSGVRKLIGAGAEEKKV